MKMDHCYTYVFAIVIAFFSWLAFYLGNRIESWLEQPEALIGGVWAMITTIMVSEAIYNDTIKAGYQRILGAFLGALISVVICTLFGYGVLQMISSVFLSFCVMKIIKIGKTVRISAATAGIIAGHGITAPQVVPWVGGSVRFLTTVIGALFAIIGAYLLKMLWHKFNH